MESFGLGNITESNHAPNTSSSATSTFPGRKSKKRREIPKPVQPSVPSPTRSPASQAAPGHGLAAAKGSVCCCKELREERWGWQRPLVPSTGPCPSLLTPPEAAHRSVRRVSSAPQQQHNGPAMTAQSLPNLRELQKVCRVQEGAKNTLRPWGAVPGHPTFSLCLIFPTSKRDHTAPLLCKGTA